MNIRKVRTTVRYAQVDEAHVENFEKPFFGGGRIVQMIMENRSFVGVVYPFDRSGKLEAWASV